MWQYTIATVVIQLLILGKACKTQTNANANNNSNIHESGENTEIHTTYEPEVTTTFPTSTDLYQKIQYLKNSTNFSSYANSRPKIDNAKLVTKLWTGQDITGFQLSFHQHMCAGFKYPSEWLYPIMPKHYTKMDIYRYKKFITKCQTSWPIFKKICVDKLGFPPLTTLQFDNDTTANTHRIKKRGLGIAALATPVISTFLLDILIPVVKGFVNQKQTQLISPFVQGTLRKANIVNSTYSNNIIHSIQREDWPGLIQNLEHLPKNPSNTFDSTNIPNPYKNWASMTLQSQRELLTSKLKDQTVAQISYLGATLKDIKLGLSQADKKIMTELSMMYKDLVTLNQQLSKMDLAGLKISYILCSIILGSLIVLLFCHYATTVKIINNLDKFNMQLKPLYRNTKQYTDIEMQTPIERTENSHFSNPNNIQCNQCPSSHTIIAQNTQINPTVQTYGQTKL